MKTLPPLLLFVLIAATAPAFAQSEIAPDTHSGPVVKAADSYLLQFEYPCGFASGEAGIETDGNYIYTSLWNSTGFCKYSLDGSYLGTFSVSGAGYVRDMAYDGTYFCGSAASNVIFVMDFTILCLVSTFTAPTATRALAFDEVEDAFFANNWSTPILHFTRAGLVLNTIPVAGDENYYGFAFNGNDPYLYGYSQKNRTSLNMLNQIELPGGYVVSSFDMLTILEMPVPGVDIAGGLFMQFDLIPGSMTLGGIVQNVCIWGVNPYYCPPPPQNDVGVTAFLSPTGGPYLGEEIVTIRVKNFGGATQNNITVYYTLDGGDPVSGVVPGPIAPGETEDFTFPGTVNLSNPGQTYVFVGCTELEGDDNPGNDCKTMMIVGWPTEYCDASTTNQQEYIQHVVFGNINQQSGWQDSIADYTHLSTSLLSGWSESIYLSIGNGRVGDSVTMWIDWNEDYFFGSDENEIYQMTDYDGTGQWFDDTITVPEATPPGNYRVRIRLTYNTTPEPCGVAEYGEIEDYTVNVITQFANDVGVVAILSPQSGFNLIEDIVTIRIKNFGTISQSNFSVFYTVDGGTPLTGMVKGPVGSGATFDFTFPGFVKFGNSGQTFLFLGCTSLEGDEVPENDCKRRYVTNLVPDYFGCTTLNEDEYIANVLFGYINKSSGWQGGVANYTDKFTMIRSGESETITITNGNAWALDNVYVWVDWNQDFDLLGNFEVEQYILTNVSGLGETFTGEIEVPDGQACGLYRMRIRMTYNTIPCPGGTDTWGEVEDYTIIVVGNSTPQIQLEPSSLISQLEPGQNTDKTLTITNSGETLLTYNLSLNPEPNTGLSNAKDDFLFADDVGITAFSLSESGMNPGSRIVTITVKNFGTATQSQIPVSLSLDTVTTSTGFIPDNLASGQSVSFTFPDTINLILFGHTNAVCACTGLSNDQNHDNDCKGEYSNYPYPDYCPAITTTEDEFIASVLFGNINNSSGWQDSIANFINQFTTIEAGTSENITVTNGLPYANDMVTAWVDWDKDFDFNSTDEMYILTNQTGTGETFTGEISVPENQPTGDYRLRIRMCYYTEPVPCGGSTYGEVEEYSIHVVNNQTIPWLSVEPMTGVVNPNDSTLLSVTFDATGLQNGMYEGSIIINSNDPGTPFTTIPVTLIIGQCPLPPPLNPEGFEILPNIAYLSWEQPDSTGNLLGYNIFRNNEMINPE